MVTLGQVNLGVHDRHVENGSAKDKEKAVEEATEYPQKTLKKGENSQTGVTYAPHANTNKRYEMQAGSLSKIVYIYRMVTSARIRLTLMIDVGQSSAVMPHLNDCGRAGRSQMQARNMLRVGSHPPGP